MSSSFKGIISVIVSCLFFFPWVWSSILHIKLSAIPLILITLIASIIALILGLQAKKGGSRILGIAGITLATISIVLSFTNIIAAIGSKI